MGLKRGTLVFCYKNPVTAAWTTSAYVEGVLVIRDYFGGTRREAITRFRKEV